MSPTLAFLSFGNNQSKRQQKKQELLQYIKPLQRGLKATDEDAATIERLCRELERINPNKASLSSPLINGRWELQYTTSDSILGRSKPPFLRPIGPIFQYIDASALTARNQETAPLFNQARARCLVSTQHMLLQVTAELTPMSRSQVKVQFKEFKLLGLLTIQAPPSARGTLDTTYLDEDLRISRGDKGAFDVLHDDAISTHIRRSFTGNLFVLTMDDPSAKP